MRFKKKACKFCGKQFDVRGLGNHERQCKAKPIQGIVVEETTPAPLEFAGLLNELHRHMNTWWNNLVVEDKLRVMKNFEV
jgi:hypothetical protein